MMRYIVWSVLLFLDYASGSSTYPELCKCVYSSGLFCMMVARSVHTQLVATVDLGAD